MVVDYWEDIAEFVKKKRTKRSNYITAAEVGKKAGICHNTILYFEEKKREMKLSILIKLLKALGYRLSITEITKSEGVMVINCWEDVAKFIKIQRQDNRQISQKKMATKVGIDDNTLSNFEHEKREMKLSNIIYCLEYLGFRLLIVENDM